MPPVVTYTDGLPPKGVPFTGFGHMKQNLLIFVFCLYLFIFNIKYLFSSLTFSSGYAWWSPVILFIKVIPKV